MSMLGLLTDGNSELDVQAKEQAAHERTRRKDDKRLVHLTPHERSLILKKERDRRSAIAYAQLLLVGLGLVACWSIGAGG